MCSSQVTIEKRSAIMITVKLKFNFYLLVNKLNSISDEDIALDSSELDSVESNLPEVLRDMWEGQFVPVGQHLLHRVKSHHTDLVPLESPS